MNILITGSNGMVGQNFYKNLDKNKFQVYLTSKSKCNINLANNFFQSDFENNNTFKNNADLNQIFKEVIDTDDNNIVFSCGSGVTASVLALAYSLINNKYTPTIYDGSWSEYGLIK